MRKKAIVFSGLAAAAFFIFSHNAAAKDKFFEVFVGFGGGYEWFKLQSVGATVLEKSLGPECTSVDCIEPDELRGHGGLWRGYGGLRLGMMGIGIDYRQSYIQGPISWGQLMGDFWIFLPIPIVKPFIKLGVGWIHLKVKDVDIPGGKKDGDLIKGFGFRGGVGLLVKPIQWISVGATCEAAGTYLREGTETTWGYAIDVTAHFTVHI